MNVTSLILPQDIQIYVTDGYRIQLSYAGVYKLKYAY